MSDKQQVTMTLSPRAAKLLAIVNEVYLKRGGPAYKCAQEWDEPFTVAEIEELSAELENAVGTPVDDAAPSPA